MIRVFVLAFIFCYVAIAVIVYAAVGAVVLFREIGFGDPAGHVVAAIGAILFAARAAYWKWSAGK